jgi:hypothetical protein
MKRVTENPNVYSAEEFSAFLGRLAKHYGNVARMAAHFGVDGSNLLKAIKGKALPPAKLLSRIGATVQVSYVLPPVTPDQK